MKKYEVLIFDADDTLFDFSYAEKSAIKKIIINKIEQKDFEKYFQIYKGINKQVWNEREQKLITFDELKSERFRRFFNAVNLKLDPEEAGKKYLLNLSKVTKLLPNVYKIINKLSKDFRLVILTNGLTSVQKPRLTNSKIFKFIELHIISEEVGYSKPEPEIFQIVCQSLNYYDKSKLLMVGDNYSSDILGGINFGIDTCWINSNNSDDLEIVKPTYQIKSLIEILKLLY